MTTTQRISRIRTSPKPVVTGRWRRRLRNYLRTIFARGDLSSLVMTWGLMIVTALAMDAAEWTEGLDVLAVVGFFSVGFGFLLARSHYSELMALILSSVYSIAVILCTNAVALVAEGALWQRVDVLSHQMHLWLDEALTGGQPAHDDVAFVMFLSVLFWFLGHNAAWHVFRVDRVWRVIIPVGLVLITNQFYYQGDNSLDIYLIAFVLLALLLLIRSHIDTREYEWFVHRVSFPNYVRRTFFYAGAVLAIAIVAVAWIAPAGTDDKSLDRVQDVLSGDTFIELAELWSRLFSSLEGEGIATVDYYGGDELQLSGAIQLGDQPVLSVSAPVGPRYYWRSTAYDSYDFNAWTWKHVRTVRAYTDEDGLRLNIGPTVPGARTEIQHTISLLIRASDLVYAAPQPVLLGLPVEAELDCILDFDHTCVNNNEPSDVAIIRARKALRRGDQYTVTSSISTASGSQLRQAGEIYPEWVLRLYLQGAERVSPRVQELTVQIITQSNAFTPYDKARAIEGWLRTYIQYNESIPAPPKDRDPIEWFLFEQRQGYCNYYATAMVLMLRSQGVPARMAAGFAQGTWDAEHNAFLVRERDAHTWVEVFFPGYGWVEFEPTADETPIERPDDQMPQNILPTVTPFPTPTFVPTITASPMAPTEASGANATPTSMGDQQIMAATPSPTVPPTSTPPPPPDVTKVGGDDSNLLKVILTTFSIIALVILAVTFAVLFTIWYVEHRGLGGLNPIQKAYARMTIYARWLGLRFQQSATPDERRRYLVGEVPAGEPPISVITRSYVRDRYGEPTSPDVEEYGSEDASEAWQEARWIFIRHRLARIFGRRSN